MSNHIIHMSPIIILAFALVIVAIIVVFGIVTNNKNKLDAYYKQKEYEAKLPPFPADPILGITSCISDIAAQKIGYSNADAAVENTCKSINRSGAWGVHDWDCKDNAGNVGKTYKCL